MKKQKKTSTALSPTDKMRELMSLPLPKAMLAKHKRELTPEQFERLKIKGITWGESLRLIDEIRKEKGRKVKR
jgi:hypothetical protein